ncbi:nucleotidyltransferase domain-containing protein [Iningainema sp. BLCCT55]|uniref:Nucleotidyltransferase domain-containing protein n=2 Tax=Iningainema TaxID=1932705 RepID=A0A8J6XS91_9CYAN|nr:nucleotidyltransferase domain-containing protein [Iningainema tapete BLCC-T55]
MNEKLQVILRQLRTRFEEIYGDRLVKMVLFGSQARGDAQSVKIQLPLDVDFDDYPRRMYEIMEVLEKAENRSQLDILSELITNTPNTTIQGIVMQIQTPNTNGKLSGKVTMIGVLVDKLRKIKTELSDHNYVLAIKAYQERLPILCTGDLIKENDTLVLKNPHNFTLGNL